MKYEILKESLAKSGVLSEIRARIRAEVFNVLQDETEPPPPISNENVFINELIREYLIYNGYLFTESVLLAESGHPQFRLERELLKERLRMKPVEEADELPLLYSLVSYFSKESKPSTSADVPTAEKS
ncbi:LisH domain-containing protein FOPNL [Araneus ventricosus]|uniref:LisH domain-containing protein FOPNL n=1 Tax=Araneus ventricosus TaxID=182803 RepID=A0A4Y2SZC9_ARAVE|nr:LisH domain-containing protein FOPNL [Araneus ventricosus]GBN93321.1 LisH domain-containing protein FOPNL [Araneus ventricosus]